MERYRPTYDLSKVKELVASGNFNATKRVSNFIRNHAGRPKMVIGGVFENAHEVDFVKSIELNIYPGTYADVYLVNYDGEDWYLKFYIDGNKTFVQVLSCNIDGYIH